MDADPALTAARRKRRTDRLGPSSVCFFCGYANPGALMVISRTLLEAHHVFGRQRNAESTVVACRNCHAEITEDLRREGISMKREHDPKELVAAMLRARAVFERKDAETMEKLAELLLEKPK